jgi:hypothetical protein
MEPTKTKVVTRRWCSKQISCKGVDGAGIMQVWKKKKKNKKRKRNESSFTTFHGIVLSLAIGAFVGLVFLLVVLYWHPPSN